MYSELECGICYRTYNAGRRCPRELQCKHSFCESCLLALARPLDPEEARPGADGSIVCPLCRHATCLSGEGAVRAGLRVDECALERLIAAGVLDREEEEEEGEEVRERSEEATLPEAPTEEGDLSAGSGGGRLRRSCRKVWGMIRGKSARQRGGGNCMSNDELRTLAMMSCFMY